MLAQGWGTRDDPQANPVMNLDQFLSPSRLNRESFVEALSGFIATRAELQTEIRKRLRKDALPYSPTGLFHSPLRVARRRSCSILSVG